MKGHPGWRVWFVPNALDGSVTWCAQREPTIHAYSSEDLDKDMGLADAELAAEADGVNPGFHARLPPATAAGSA